MKSLRVLLLMAMMVAFHAVAQRPCRDTVVNVFDSICEGSTYNFDGHSLSRQGVYFDTVKRAGTTCDSVIILHLAVLEPPWSTPYEQRFCGANPGYRLSAVSGNYFQWTSQPHDTALDAQSGNSSIFVNPAQPTTYTLYVDWRAMPQCPAQGSLRVDPLISVHAVMKAYVKDFSYRDLQVVLEDRSSGNREAPYGGWAGRSWYINGQRQSRSGVKEEFPVQPWMGDSIEVMMEAYNANCVDTAYRVIPFPKGMISFPNAFMPDQSENNTFGPLCSGIAEYELWIYDRGGVLVYHTADLDHPWDGTHHGKPCATGVYVYRCRYIDQVTPNGSQFLTGTVSLIR